MRRYPPTHCLLTVGGSIVGGLQRSQSPFARQASTQQAPPAQPKGSSSAKPRDIPNFEDKTVYERKTLTQILRGLVTLRLCRTKILVENGPGLLQWSNYEFLQGTLKCSRGLSEYLVYNTFVKWTMFQHFCGGTSAKALVPVLQDLEKHHIGAILDYAAEAEGAHGVLFKKQQKQQHLAALDVSMKSLVTRTDLQYVANEADYDATAKAVTECIDAGRGGYGDDRVCFASMKLTGLAEPQLLARVSAVLLSIRQGWVKVFTNDPAPRNLEDCRVVIGRHTNASNRFAPLDRVRQGLKTVWKPTATEAQREAFIKYLIKKGKETGSATTQPDDQVDYLVYINELALALLAEKPPAELQPMLDVLPQFTAQEKQLVQRLKDRTRLIAERAKAKKVFLMVDAEQTFYQMAIDQIVRELQREYNKGESALIYNTYQCYLTYAEDRLRNDLARGEREGWKWAGRMVRGAYMNQERKTAEKYNYDSPIQKDLQATTACFHACGDIIMNQIITKGETSPIGVNFGTHNVASVEAFCKSMQKVDWSKNKSIVSFAQLYGMADYLSLPLARSGYLVYKYVPYGPVKECVEYLGRRALENSAVAETSRRDSSLLMFEAIRRLRLVIALAVLCLFGAFALRFR